MILVNPYSFASSNKDAILVIGDSKSIGSNNATGPGPTPTAGTVKQYNATTGTVVDIGSADVYNVVAGGGTFMPQMGINYNTSTGRIPVFISCGSSGSNFSPDGDSNNWSSTGTLRASTQATVTSAISAIGVANLKAICVVLGVNDARNTEAVQPIATIETDIDDFFLWVTTTYPGVKVYVSMVGRYPTQAHDSRLYAIRYRVLQNCITYTNVEVAFSEASEISAGGYGAGDNLHLVQTGYNDMGASFARAIDPSNQIYSKWARSIIACMYDNLTTTRKGLIDAWVTSLGSHYFELENAGFFKTSAQGNVYVDWTFLGYFFNNSGTWVTDSHIATDGSTNSYAYTFRSDINNKRASQTDFFTILKIKTNSTPNGTLGYAFGVYNGTTLNGLVQSTTPSILYRANDGTLNPYLTETSFASGNAYGIARNGTTKYLLKNTSQLATATVASTGTAAFLPVIGGLNTSGTTGNRLNAQYTWMVSGKFSTNDIPTIVNACNALESGW